MSVYSANMNHRSFIWQISAVCFILGLILAAAVVTSGQVARSGKGPRIAGFTYDLNIEFKQATEKKESEYESVIKQKTELISKLEDRLSRGNSASSLIRKELEDTQFNSGLTDAIGPGIRITLTDSLKPPVVGNDGFKLSILIHDSDINAVVNELKACGAEAIAVNHQRIVSSTSIRCVGPVVHVNGVPSAPPYIIEAIGDPDGLMNGMNLPGGVFTDLRRFDPDMIHIVKQSAMRLPAFGGDPKMKYAHPPAPPAESDHDSAHSDN
jgi:uncharacterized protein YlxW (UPF0749 family)